jgi:hypothetical protein
MKLVIDRGKWDRGSGCSALLRDGKMCCLGFYAEACGLKDSDIKNIGTPSVLAKRGVKIPKAMKWLLFSGDDSVDCSNLIQANDNQRQPNREEKIARLFAKHDVTVEFTGR